MVTRPGEGQEWQSVQDERDLRGSGAVDTGLPVQPIHQEGSHGDSGVRDHGEPVGTHPPMRDDDGGEGPGADRADHIISASSSDSGGLRSGHDGNRIDGEGSYTAGIPSLKEIDSAKLPDVPDRYRNEAKETVADDTAAWLRDRDELPSGELEELTEISLKVAKEILEKNLKDDDDDYMSLLRAKAGLVQTIFTAQLRADEGRFRKRQADTLEKLLERMAFEERKMIKNVN